MTAELSVGAADASRRKSSTARLRRTTPAWLTRYAAGVVASDIVAVLLATASYGLWGSAEMAVLLNGGAIVLGIVATALLISKAWNPAGLGQGTAEFARLFNGMAGAAITMGLVSLAVQAPQGRPWVFGVVPIAAMLATIGRKMLRVNLHRRRRAGEAMRSVLAVGTVESVSRLIQRTRRARHEGLSITAACIPGGAQPGQRVEGVTVVGDVHNAERIAASGAYDVVSVGPNPGWGATELRSLAWSLEATQVALVVDPGLMEIAGPRLHTSSIDGFPLLQLSHPRFSGLARVVKNGFDKIVALSLLLLTLPVLTTIAVIVKFDGGPVFFRQTRVGIGGREFKMIKFRSMVVDAEAKLAALQAQNQGAGLLFKMKNDPRITKIGAVLRKYSLDELPQLLNVVIGDMSLVGPRPPLPSEVVGYERAAQRRLLVKPGMTGLWQVSGRSDLSWEESVRLDLRYVENWTFALDLQILVRTVRAVKSGGGAY